MSRHAYGPVWYQAHMRPGAISTSNGEALPKRVPMTGCGFSGVSGDFPSERLKWYTPDGRGSAAGDTVFLSKAKNSTAGTAGSGAFLWEQRPTPAPPLPGSSRSVREGLASSSSAPNLGSFTPTVDCRERSHTMLHYGRSRAPETLRCAGHSCFDMRRFQETNTAAPFL
mmetsp:Transcript_4358/g.11821  ORF Transcript_4358/g.11821 Transcript_4358/m.11821 type:complete len:169 (-) Transcript_4358:112-618(-)